MAIPVSVIIMTKNEQHNLPDALRSVREFTQVFVVDSNSTDDTVALAHAAGAQVVPFHWTGAYPKKKQWCLENLDFANDWVFYVDADERVTPGLSRELASLLNQGNATKRGYFVELDYVFLGRVLRHGYRVHKLALLDHRAARFLDYDDLDATNMWEVEGHYQPHIDGTVGNLKGRLEHRDHDDLFGYFERHNRYSDWEAALCVKNALVLPDETQTRGRSIAKRIFVAVPFKGLLFFVYSYIIRLGFLDGAAGLHYALAKAYYYWQTGLKERELKMRRVP